MYTDASSSLFFSLILLADWKQPDSLLHDGCRRIFLHNYDGGEYLYMIWYDMIWYDMMIWYDLVGLVFGWMCNRVDKTMMCNCVTWYVWRRWLQQCLVKAALVIQQEPAVLLIVISISTSTFISMPVLAWIWLWMWKWFNGCAWKLQTHSWWNCKIHYMYHSLSCIAQYV